MHDNVQSDNWGSPQWQHDYFMIHGFYPIAGGESEDTSAATDQGGDSGGLYDLNSVPEDYRPHVEKIAKEIDANVTRKFQEAAQYKSQWEPYEQLGINEYEPEQLEQLLTFAEIANDPDSFKEWWTNVGNEYGFMEQNDDVDDIDVDDDNDPAELVEALLEEKLGPLYQKELEREEQARIAEAEEMIDREVAALKEQHGDFNEDIIYKLALAHEGNDAIQKAFQEYQELVSNTEKQTVTDKSNPPVVPEGPGAANTNQNVPTNFDEASAMAKERMKASLGS